MSNVSEYTAYMDARRRMQESFDAERAQAKDNHERDIQSIKEDYNDDAKRVKNEYQERLVSEKESAREEVQKLKNDLYDAQGKRSTQQSVERLREQKELVQYKQDIEKEAQRQIQRSDEYSNHRAIEAAKRQDEQIGNALEMQKRSHVEEVKTLKDEIDMHRSYDHDVAKERANAKAEVIEQYEGEHIQERDRLVDAYESQVKKLHNDKEELKNYMGRELTRSEYETNAKTQGLLKRQKDEFIKIEKDIKQDHRRVEDTLQDQLRREKERTTYTMNNVIEMEGGRTAEALNQKDQTYREYLARRDQEVRNELGEKEAKIKMLETTDDPQKVSPALVEKIHSQERNMAHKELSAYKNSQKQNVEASRLRDLDDRSEMRRNFNETTTAIARKAQMDNDRTIRDLNTAYVDLKEKQDLQISEAKEKSQSTVERMQVQNAQELAHLQKRDMESMQDQRLQLGQQMDQVRDEADLQRKAQDREWYMKTNTMRRDFERKLTDIQEENTKMTQEIRFEYDKKLRDLDRNSKAALEDRVRQYEHMLKQQELAFKEKERFLKEQSQEELDKMRRANAHLLQKKS